MFRLRIGIIFGKNAKDYELIFVSLWPKVRLSVPIKGVI